MDNVQKLKKAIIDFYASLPQHIADARDFSEPKQRFIDNDTRLNQLLHDAPECIDFANYYAGLLLTKLAPRKVPEHLFSDLIYSNFEHLLEVVRMYVLLSDRKYEKMSDLPIVQLYLSMLKYAYDIAPEKGGDEEGPALIYYFNKSFTEIMERLKKATARKEVADFAEWWAGSIICSMITLIDGEHWDTFVGAMIDYTEQLLWFTERHIMFLSSEKGENVVEYFNEYGNIPMDGVIDEFTQEMERHLRRFFEEMIKNGASVLELRAASQHIMSNIDGIVGSVLSWNEDYQRRQAEKTKKEKVQ